MIELKRPSVKITSEVSAQLMSYAVAVAEDERFRDTRTKWVFWAVSNEVDPLVRRQARQRNRPEGLLLEDEEQRITVWAFSWGQLIEACRGRLEFFQKHLGYSVDQESSLAHLRKAKCTRRLCPPSS